jgi:catechol 2,3-dioxygenase-like lactoylglutathione lyase family enzyme
VSRGRSEVEAIVETAIDVDDPEVAEPFYRDVHGLEVIGTEAGRHVFFRVGDGVLLAFAPEATLKGDMLPPHGARGPGHARKGLSAPLQQYRHDARPDADHGYALGLENSFSDVGREARDGEVAPGVPPPEDIEKLLEAAPRYGIEIGLPTSA